MPLRPILLAGLLALAAAVPSSAVAAAPAPAWATVNLCDPPERPGAVGVRAGIPAGPGAAWIRVRAEWFDAVSGTWLDVRTGGDGGWQRLGDGRSGLRGGTTFSFRLPASGRVLVVRGRVHVQYRRGARVLRRLLLRTSAGHEARAGGVSLAECRVQR